MRKNIISVLYVILIPCLVVSQELRFVKKGNAYQVQVAARDKLMLYSPPEGLWSVALGWEQGWPGQWQHVAATKVESMGDWQLVTGSLNLPQGEWLFSDNYIKERGRIKCIRRFTWKGEVTLEKITLSVRWQTPSATAKPFLPGILFYGNPSGEKNGKDNVAWYHSQPGDEALFEEHRYPMPFACLEWKDNNAYFAAALHTLPSPVYRGNHFDQWWSLGIKTNIDNTELEMLSAPVCYNGQKNIAKALQSRALPYGDTYIQVTPGTVIEKTFYLEASPVERKGTGFIASVNTSIDIFKPFYTGDLPAYEQIVQQKYRFAQSRWVQGPAYAGYNMFPSAVSPQIVLGWAGQCEAPGYALQVLAKELNDDSIWNKVQRSLDHISTSPIDKEGFCVIYNTETGKWSGKDPVSQGQAMNNIALAIKQGRQNRKVNTTKWETFLRRATAVVANRLQSPEWKPVNTAEAFFISPLIIASTLFHQPVFRDAALKAANYYATRHLSMEEPYWGGTLDATCEDKEGAWGAFQGFLAAYELTRDRKYLDWAKHACYIVLSYTVVWDIPMPAGRLADHGFKTRGWTGVSAQNQHLDVYGVLIAPSIYKMGIYLKDDALKKLALTMFRSCGQLIDPSGSQGEQIQHTNFAQLGDMSNVFKLRGGYAESWTVFWITAHFLHAAAEFKELGITW